MELNRKHHRKVRGFENSTNLLKTKGYTPHSTLTTPPHLMMSWRWSGLSVVCSSWWVVGWVWCGWVVGGVVWGKGSVLVIIFLSWLSLWKYIPSFLFFRFNDFLQEVRSQLKKIIIQVGTDFNGFCQFITPVFLYTYLIHS